MLPVHDRPATEGTSPPSWGLPPESFRSRLFLTVGVLTAVAALVLALAYLRDVLVLVFAAVLIALFLRALTDAVKRWTGIPDAAALAAVVAALMLLIGAAGWLMYLPVAREIDQFIQQAPSYVRGLEEEARQYAWGRQLLDRAQEVTPAGAGEAVRRAASAASTAISTAAGVLLCIVVALYGAISPQTYVDGLVRLVPPDSRPRAREAMAETGLALRRWLVGMAFQMLVVGVCTGLGLWALGVPMALTLGLIAGLAEFVVYLGPILGFVPIFLVALNQSTGQAVNVVILYLVIQGLESYVLTPLVQQRAVSLPPALTIAGQLALGALIGAGGVALAVPMLVVLMVLVKVLYIRGVLHEEAEVIEGAG